MNTTIKRIAGIIPRKIFIKLSFSQRQNELNTFEDRMNDNQKNEFNDGYLNNIENNTFTSDQAKYLKMQLILRGAK